MENLDEDKYLKNLNDYRKDESKTLKFILAEFSVLNPTSSQLHDPEDPTILHKRSFP